MTPGTIGGWVEAAVEFGWGARLMAEQFPALSEKDAGKFDSLNRAIILCHLHGLISDSSRDTAIRRCTKEIGRTLARAARHAPQGDGLPSLPASKDPSP